MVLPGALLPCFRSSSLLYQVFSSGIPEEMPGKCEESPKKSNYGLLPGRLVKQGYESFGSPHRCCGNRVVYTR
jgi:hypothetical protein